MDVMREFKGNYDGVHTETQHFKCVRDTGYNLTAILKDLKQGGIKNVLSVAKKYWQGTKSQLGKGEQNYAVEVNKLLEKRLHKENVDKAKVSLLINIMNEIVKFGLMDLDERIQERYVKIAELVQNGITSEQLQGLPTISGDKIGMAEKVLSELIKGKSLEEVGKKFNIGPNALKRFFLPNIGSEDSILKKIMKKRENILHYDEGKIPERGVIDQILKDAHDLVPLKNNLYPYTIEVYGPEHAEEKKQIALLTVGGMKKREVAEEDLGGLYDRWLKSNDGDAKLELIGDEKGNSYMFNNQVRAPYLLVYTFNKKTKATNKQKEDGFVSPMFNENLGVDQKIIGASMNAYGVTLLAAEQNVHASFCKCYLNNDTAYNTNILKSLDPKDDNQLLFLLGLGYRDYDRYYWKNEVKPDYKEIVKWRNEDISG